MEWIMIIGITVIAIAILGLIGSFIIWISARVVAGFWPPFKTAVGVSIAVMLMNALVKWGVGQTIGFTNQSELACFAVCFALEAALFGQMLRHPEDGPIGFGKGAMVTLLPYGVLAVLCFGLYMMSPVEKREAYIASFKTAWEKQRSRERWFRPASADASTPEARPALTPAPSAGVQPSRPALSSAEAQREALRLYPALGVAGSDFNKEFCKRYRQYQQEQPRYFEDPAWPLRLAEETKTALLPK